MQPPAVLRLTRLIYTSVATMGLTCATRATHPSHPQLSGIYLSRHCVSTLLHNIHGSAADYSN